MAGQRRKTIQKRTFQPSIKRPRLAPSLTINESLLVTDTERSEQVKTEERRESMRISDMNPYHWHKIAAVSGIAALGLGTYGFHMFKPEKPIFKEVWQTASLYHLFHTAALLAAPITKRPHVFGGLLTAGILAFSGSCYTAAYLEDRNYSALAPFGGFAFVAGWASLLF